jgi:prepilin-type processing-associated H-X9-DG protein
MRAAARATACQSNLRQLAQAVHQYLDVHGMLPGWQQHNALPPGVYAEEVYSFPSLHAQLLPFLDQSELYEAVNLRLARVPMDYSADPRTWSAQTTAANTRIAIFICPADTAPHDWPAPNSYRGNWGVGPGWAQNPLFPDSANGFFASATFISIYPVRTTQIYDGLTRTAMFSERLLGSGNPANFDQLRDLKPVPPGVPFSNVPETLAACGVLAKDPNAGTYTNAGKYWLFSGLHHTLYTHALPPNASLTDCLNFAMTPPWGASTARSLHPGRVNVAFGDGSLRTVADSVDWHVWRSLGTRNGGEVVLDSSY